MEKNKQNERLPYLNPELAVGERVDDLFSRMNLDEKIAQIGSIWVYELFTNKEPDEEKILTLLKNGIGQITRVGGASDLDPCESASLSNKIQRFLMEETRLKIPAMVHEECCSGYMARGATCFPQAIGVASTWDQDLSKDMASIVKTQMRAAGAHQALSPVLDISRDPRWGRIEETYGEDPYLASQMGVSFVKGLQGEDLSGGIIATGKHFVGYGASEGGRNLGPAYIPKRELFETYIFPFEAAIKEGGMLSIMNGYNELNSVPCCASKEFLTKILRDKLDFKGLIVSDYFAIKMLMDLHFLTSDKKDSAIRALAAGIDIELPSTDCFGQPLLKCIQDGHINEKIIERAVKINLKLKFMLGLFEKPFVNPKDIYKVFNTPNNRYLSRAIAEKSIILLKNEKNILPLSNKISSIAVIGPNANNARNLLGDYSYTAHIENLIEMRKNPEVFNTPIPDKFDYKENYIANSSVLSAIKKIVSPDTSVYYDKGCDVKENSVENFDKALEIAEKSDVVIMCVGGKSGLTPDCTCGENRDRTEIGLPGIQEKLVRKIFELGKTMIVVLINGRPLSSLWIKQNIDSILEAWLPGEEGAQAIANVLFGKYNPGGKLPVTIPRNVGQIPLYYNNKPSEVKSSYNYSDKDTLDATVPLFPFGYGLSYTKFKFTNLDIKQKQIKAGEYSEIRIDITNTGSCKGDEVIQLYIHGTSSEIVRPIKELKGFKRITLDPNEKKTIEFKLFANQLGFYDNNLNYILEPGMIEVMLGSSSIDILLNGAIEIIGKKEDIGKSKIFSSECIIK